MNGDDLLATGVLPLVARLCLSAIFVPAMISKAFDFAGNASYMAQNHVPFTKPLLAVALVIEWVGSICLVVGFRARAAALVLAAYLVPVTLLLHQSFQTQFLKNVGLIGGLLLVVAYGPGRFALDAKRHRS